MSHQPNNIFAGTQVVALIEVRGPGKSLVHPRGAVGVVTRTPAVAGEQYLVRFPDGFEASFPHEQLEILKHFKDRLGCSAGILPANSGSIPAPGFNDSKQGCSANPPAGSPRHDNFDLESVIIYRCVVGSRAYGLETDDSDTDRRGIYLAPADLQWSLFGAPDQFEDNATQSCYWELQTFLTMALKANPNILECLYSPMVEKVTPLGAELMAIRDSFHLLLINVVASGLWSARKQEAVWIEPATELMSESCQLAALDISRATLAQIEARLRCVTDVELLQFAQVLGGSTDSLYPRGSR